MYCVKRITDDLTWIGANDRRLAMFEGVYSVPDGVSYNSYLLKDEKTVIFDTVDKAVRHRFMENLTHALGGRMPDYLVVLHMEPDHSASLTELAGLYPDMQFVCNTKTLNFIRNFHDVDLTSRAVIVKEGDTLSTGKHVLHFAMAPMVHWPEVMVAYDSSDKVLFSADAFGAFGALNGALFADEVDYDKDYMDEARRYYTNIVGKYGAQTEALLNKASAFDIEIICPLHGFVWRRNLNDIIAKYRLWSEYQPEEHGVMIAYASVYGNTENAAEILSSALRDRGVRTVMFDVSVVPASEIVSAAFRWSHLVFASTTYNAGIFITMEEVLSDLVAHNIQNRTVAIIENGSWAAASGGLMREKLSKCKNMNIIESQVSLTSSLKGSQLAQIDEMADAIAATFPRSGMPAAVASGKTQGEASIDLTAMFKLSYGLFVLAARDGGKDNACIINTASQLAETPLLISVTVNKSNLTHDMIVSSGELTLSVLSESAPFSVFERFGFHSGRDVDKFAGGGDVMRAAGGVRYLNEHVNSVIAAKVVDAHDYATHTLFVAEVTQAIILSAEPSVTYQYYFDHIKPKPSPQKQGKKGFVCRICGYILEGDTLPPDYICPLCKHGAADFEAI